jgi:ribosomal protein S18 acetylase RimI-like enzyme
MKIRVERKEIPVQTYRDLRKNTGLSQKSEKAARIGLANTLFSILVSAENNEHIGMGRVVGDGGCACQVVDICVLPDYQGIGVGKLIMREIKNFIDSELPETCYVSLIADGDASFLYEKFGFRDTMPVSKGMFLRK